ncbi:barstar family protein [Nocardioides sp.]|uniref:barstar family protein n=1 Tax=Nocardioides sp. TaxID=35761 RepID=UPI0039E39F03
MSGLAGLLAGRHEPGVYLWPAAFDVADVRHTVGLAEWHFAYLDGAGVASKDDLWTALAAALGFPDYFGRNLDALWDCLGDLDEPQLLLWDAWGPLAWTDPDTFAGITAVLSERTEMGGFTVLLRGDGPDTGLPTLA